MPEDVSDRFYCENCGIYAPGQLCEFCGSKALDLGSIEEMTDNLTDDSLDDDMVTTPKRKLKAFSELDDEDINLLDSLESDGFYADEDLAAAI